MKKIILSVLTLLAISTTVNAQNVNIPDANFKNWLLNNTNLNTNGDLEVQLSEANNYSLAINVGSLSISDLTGIEEFINAVQLNCSGNQLTSLDVSNNPNLNLLNCSNNDLSSLDMRNISTSTLFNSSSFNATGNSNLTCISVDNVSGAQSTWTNLDAQTSFSTNCPPPCTVTIPDANFKAYLVGNTAINTNGDTEIQCSEATAFTGTISCNNMSISDLTGIEEFINLTELSFGTNNITQVDLSNNTALSSLICYQNSLTSLTLTNNIALNHLNYDQNSITTIDLSSNLSLQTLRCANNSITSLDVSGLPALYLIHCSHNSLINLNVANGNNTNINNGFFFAHVNPNLTCIEVDDVTYSTTNWTTIDPASSFSLNCGGSIGVNEANGLLSEVEIYPNPVQNELFLDLGQNQATQINILNVSGQVVQSIVNNNVKSIDVSGLNQGIYILKIQTEHGISMNRFVKK